ncbi:MAG: hypothetical protein ACKVZJ_08695 [Phycisphaerales bacterium]
MTLRTSLRGMMWTATALVCAAGAAGQTTTATKYEQLWGAFGPTEPQVQTELVPDMKEGRVVVLYAGQAGLYPKVWNGIIVNGGVPVSVDMNVHLTKLAADITRQVPANFDGYAVIDYEDWDALWVDTPELYREMTREVVRAQYSGLTPEQVEAFAKRDHEAAAKSFMLATLNAAKAQRPNAKWGYYGYPRTHHVEHLAEMQWLWDASTALYPVAYTVYPMNETRPTPWDHAPPEYFPGLMQTLVGTSRQLAGTSKPVAAFVWCRYHNNNPSFQYQMMNETDLRRMLREPRLKGADAAIFWDYFGNTTQANEYNSYFTSLLARVADEVDLEFNPPASSQAAPPTPPPGNGAGSQQSAPPQPPPGGGSGGGSSGGSGSSGSTGTYTNTSIPGAPFVPPPNNSTTTNNGGTSGATNGGTTAPDAGDGTLPGGAPGASPGETPPAEQTAANTDNNPPKASKDKKSKKAKKGVGTRTNSRFAAGNKQRILQRDRDRAAAQLRLAERARRNGQPVPRPAQPGQSLADVPIRE